MIKEKREEVRPVRVSAVCECGGEMYTGRVAQSMPLTIPVTRFLHCRQCKLEAFTQEEYPRIEYELVRPA